MADPARHYILAREMTTKFLPTVLHGEDWTYLRLSGVIDEDNELLGLLDRITGSRLFVDLIDVERINSCGVRDWVNWLDAVTHDRKDTVLLDCSPAIVAQLNLVENFAARAAVLSVTAPWYCETCDLERTSVLRVAELQASAHPRPDALRCEACAGAMAFDDIEDSYFAFLREVRTVKDRPDLDRVLTCAREMLGEPAGPLTTAERPVLPPLAPAPARLPAPRKPTAPARPVLPDKPPMIAASDVPPAMSSTDMIFYVAVGVLSAILIMVVLQIALP
ncbi:MAG: anti-anti-sigma regulatory factor [Myxococcota bacterium]